MKNFLKYFSPLNTPSDVVKRMAALGSEARSNKENKYTTKENENTRNFLV